MYKLIVIYHKHVTSIDFFEKFAAEAAQTLIHENKMKDVYCVSFIIDDSPPKSPKNVCVSLQTFK